MKRNYQKDLDTELELIAASGVRPRLLLHSCCGPCSSYVLEYLARHFEITVLYFNPNIHPLEEYDKRASEQHRLLTLMELPESTELLIAPYEPWRFYEAAAGLEAEPEGGARCVQCFRLRLEEAAAVAAEGGFDYFTTTLSVSPHKDADVLNEIGAELSEKLGVKYLYSDFKKKNGYKRSIELSGALGIYRQEYCGCEFSVR